MTEKLEFDEHELDYRFSLANERTFLAWIRTALGLIAGGVAVHQLGADRVRNALSASCIVLAALVAAGSYLQWGRVERAMRQNLPLPASGMLPILSFGTGLIAAIACVTVFFP